MSYGQCVSSIFVSYAIPQMSFKGISVDRILLRKELAIERLEIEVLKTLLFIEVLLTDIFKLTSAIRIP